MFKKATVLVVLSAALASVALTQSAGASESPEWSLEDCVDAAGKPATKLTSGAVCELKNRKNNQCLIRVSHMGQVDWDFGSCDTHSKSARLVKEGGGELKCDDTFALELGVGGSKTEWFRKCVNPQTVGIGICSDDVTKPEKKHFDWKLKGCSAGQLEAGKPFALFNVSKGDSVVFAKRASKVVDTCWNDVMKDIPRVGRQCPAVRD